MEISLCMIVKNEESCLANCLDSVRDLVDEIVIVDTGSTDKTKEIALRYTDKIYDFEWVNDFSVARNFAFSKGTKEYLMWLDADDIITEDNSKAFRELKDTIDPKYEVIYMPYLLYLDGALFKSFPRERIVKRRTGFTWRYEIHELISTEKVGDDLLFHSTVAVTHTSPPEKSERNLNILEAIINKGKPSVRTRYYYASELGNYERIDEAVLQLETFFEEGGFTSPQNLSACLMLHRIYTEKGEYEKALKIMSEGLPYCKKFSEFCCQLGDFYREIVEDMDEAIFWYEEALNCPNNVVEFQERMERYYYYIPNFWLWQLYEGQHNDEKAQHYLQSALHYMKKLEESGAVPSEP